MPKDKTVRESERFCVYIKKKSYEGDEEDNTLNTKMTNPQQADIPSFTLTINDLIKDAQGIHEFRGNNDYALSSFLQEVDTLLPLFDSSPLAKQYVFQRIIINKIQGPALNVVRTLGPGKSWEDIKAVLIQNFGVRESYYQLHQQALSVKNFQVREYFISLRKILDKLNEKYEYDNSKPIEFSPKNNESVILRIFLNNIDCNLASIIYNKNINNLRDAFYYLENLGLIRENKNKNINNNNHKINNHSKQSNYQSNTKPNSNSNFRQDRQNNSRQDNSGYFKRNHYWEGTNNLRHNNNNNNSVQSRYNEHRQNFKNNPEPMEVDHIEEINFQLMPPKQVYR